MTVDYFFDGIWGLAALVCGVQIIITRSIEVSDNTKSQLKVRGWGAIAIGVALIVWSVLMFGSVLGIISLPHVD